MLHHTAEIVAVGTELLLGSIANTQVSLNMVDIGAAQLAMHSAFETAGAQDTAYMVRALRTFFGLSLQVDVDGTYRL